ncbi:substrate-binding domain-containing protein [Actinoplanes sp. NPDC051494]|uniref:substrate-binding domain-containing protein n=1 Tax=Actinoplanes sp. NPDC051494 TaxID=3363907 RepID=UPI0037A8D81E
MVSAAGGDGAATFMLWAAAGMAVVLAVVVISLIAGGRQRNEPPINPAPSTNPTSLLELSARHQSEKVAWGQAPAQHRKGGRWTVAVLTVLLLAAVTGAMTLLQRKSDEPPPAAVAECPDADLKVAAAPEIAPVVEVAARTLAPAGSECGPVQVVAQEPAVTEASSSNPDVWIPSSTAWLGLAATNGITYDVGGAPIAYSPLVLAATPEQSATFAKGDRTTWAALIDGVAKRTVASVSMTDPLDSTTGLLTVHAVHEAMKKTTPDAGIAQLRALTLRSRLKNANADPVGLFDSYAKGGRATTTDVGVFPTTEQQLAAYKKGNHAVPLTATYPQDGVVEADYPFAVARSSTQKGLANRLRKAISKAAVTNAGFQTKSTENALELPGEPDQLLGEAQQWSRYKVLPFQVLLLVDTSGSMNQKVTDKAGRARTKADLLRESGANANQLFGEDTSIGMWYFSTPSETSPAHVEMVPLGPLTDEVNGRPRRALMGAAIAGYKAPANAGTPLFQTVLDGTAEVRSKARPGAANLVIVLTDGQDEESPFAMPQAEFMDKLKSEQNPEVPVPIIAVGYGQDADMGALNAMADATGGMAISADNPADMASAIAQAFLAAHAPK